MKIKNLIKLLSAALFTNVALTKVVFTNDCSDIKIYLDERNKDYYENIKLCKIDTDGNVIELNIESVTLTEEEINKILSYNTLKKVKYSSGIVREDEEGNKKESLFDSEPDVLAKLPNLEELELRDYSYKAYSYGTLNSGAFKNSKSLKKLTLYRFKYTDENINDIATLTNLEELKMTLMYESKNLDSLSSLTKLKVLHIDYPHNSPYEKIPNVVFSLTDLRELHIVQNEIKYVPDKITNLKKLEVLNLKSNNIRKPLPNALNYLPKLKYVNFDGNPDLIGKTLINKNLEKCIYPEGANMCIENNIPCLEGYDYKPCSIDGDCKEIKSLLDSNRINYYEVIDHCVANSNGKIKTLAITDRSLDDDIKTKLLSYDSIKVLNYTSYDCEYPEAINKLSKLEELNIIDRNSKCVINKNIFKLPDTIKKLYIERSVITQDIINKITSLTSLEELIFDDNTMENVNLANIAKLTELKTFGILFSSSHYSEIPQFIYSLTKLKKLILTQVGIDTISEEIANLKDLTYLQLNGNSIDDEGFNQLLNLRNLKHLDVSYSVISKIPEEIKNLYKLEYLNICFNDIKSIPKALFSLAKLRYLNINNNPVKTIDEDFGKLKKLEYLDLYNIKIGYVPSSILDLQNLKVLIMDRCNLVTIPENIGNLSKLEKITFSMNRITNLPSSLGNLKHLKTLILSNNDIDAEIPGSLNLLTNLRQVIFYNNKNITGKVLTNKSLNLCEYNDLDKLCKPMDNIPCLQDVEIKPCSSSSTTTATTTTTIKVTTISKNGKCGNEFGLCPSNKCCSQHGWCGTSSSYCGAGCQPQFGQCDGVPSTPSNISNNGKCGKGFGICPSGKCCSQYGWCGTTEEFCGTGCKPEFGKCDPVTSKKITTTDKTTTYNAMVTNTHADGKCGEGFGNCPIGKCCGQNGLCGSTDEFCGDGCQPEFGQCISKSGKCGKGIGRCPEGQCCNKSGWCGTSSDDCGTGCQTNYGQCN